MSDLEAFRESVSELQRVQVALGGIDKDNGHDWRREFIDLRRKLQLQISNVATAANGSRRLSGDDGLAREVKSALSRMRSTLALHQANWPAVAIDGDNPAYVRSTASVRDANKAFMEVARRVLSGE